MRAVIIILTLLQTIFAQKMLESFDLDGMNRFKGETTYRFEMKSGDLQERSLMIKGVKGDISLNGSAGSEIVIVETITIKSLSRKKAENIFDEKKAKVYRAPGTDNISVTGVLMKSSKVQFDYDIEIPRRFNVDLITSGGDIYCRQVEGTIIGKTSGGSIEFSWLTGKIEGKTSGGDITIEESQGSITGTTSGGDIDIAASEGIISVRTSGGDIDAADVNGKLTVKTSGGDIEISHINGNKAEATTSGGDIEAEYISADLKVRTSGGSIEVFQLDGNLDAFTSGGDIELEHIDGDISASTSGGSVEGDFLTGAITAVSNGGDIRVSKSWRGNNNSHTINLEAKSGDIELELPANFPASIDAAVTGGHSSRAIESDFPISIVIGDNQVSGTGINGSGEYQVLLRCSNGRITIERD